jgi:two-component system sensor histidine kinase TctE
VRPVAERQGAARVHLGLARAAGAAIVRIADNGPGLPHDERERVFDRFVRGRSPFASGTGLGLAIVRETARVHGGTAVLDDGLDGDGLALDIRLPLA